MYGDKKDSGKYAADLQGPLIGALALAAICKKLKSRKCTGAIEGAIDRVIQIEAEYASVFKALSSVGKRGKEMSAPIPKAGKPVVLVVDDDRIVRLMLRRVLEDEGYEVAEAEDGAQAVAVYERLQPDMVLMDAMMPVMDGFTACARLRELPGGDRTPVLIVTGLEDDKSVELAFESGAADFIPKPIHWAALRHRVRRLLRARRTEILLERSETGVQSVITHALNGIITVDEHGLIQSFNPAAERIFGYRSSEVIGQDIRLLMPHAYRRQDSYLRSDQRAAEKEVRGVTREITGRRRDGTIIPIEITISGFYAGEQRLFTVRDITERKQAEHKLRLAAKVFESIAEGIVVTDSEGTIQSVNPGFTAITGYSEEEVTGKNLPLFESGQHEAEFQQNIWASLRKTGQWQGEIWARRKNGETYPSWTSINAIKDERGRTTQYVAVFIDITERVKLREERQRLQEQTARVERLASLSAMSAGIAHEINQPLNAIKVLADGMLYWYKKGHPLDLGKVIESLQKISAQAGRIDEIIKHVRSFTRAGDVTELAPCNLNVAVNGALDILGRQLSAHGVVVRKELTENLPEVLGNASRLEEVVINLLVNAMQALDALSHTEKEISCVTRLGKIGKGKKGVILEISDNGPGISDELKGKIFEPFFSTKKTGEGMGLGLSIVQSIVTGYNGRIEVFNNEKGGATFRVEFPAMENGADRR